MADRTPEDILAYCERATPGPWGWDTQWLPCYANGERDGLVKGAYDCLFTANARTDLPRLAREVIELREQVQEARDIIMGINQNTTKEWIDMTNDWLGRTG